MMMTEFRGDCVSALRELVACKDLADAIDRREAMRHTHNPLQLAETAVMREEYRERKAKAWAAARALLAQHP
jgi:hypothetical protein